MSIFTGVNKTPAQKRYEVILEKASKLFKGEKNRCKSSFGDLWGDPSNPTSMEEAQATLDLFGSDATQLFIVHKAWQTFIATFDPSYEIIEPPYDIAFNQDGTVTLSEIGSTSSSSSEV